MFAVHCWWCCCSNWKCHSTKWNPVLTFCLETSTQVKRIKHERHSISLEMISNERAKILICFFSSNAIEERVCFNIHIWMFIKRMRVCVWVCLQHQQKKVYSLEWNVGKKRRKISETEIRLTYTEIMLIESTREVTWI